MSYEYRQFLKSPYWTKVKQAVLSRDNHRCVKCGYTRGLQIHHTSYNHKGLEHDNLSELMTLCGDCHQVIHGLK
jgi:5-methylcytosine-specific restriction endonuclease McrA